jgi:hypothetical protein
MIKQVLFNPTFLGIVLGLFINCVVWLLQKLYESKNLNDEKLYIRKNFLYDLIQEAEENLRQVNSKKFYGFAEI